MAPLIALSTQVRAQDSFFVAFGYAGANSYNCKPSVSEVMKYDLAWYNGTTTLTLTGNPSECPDVTFEPLKNDFGIGGVTVPGNASLDRSKYDTNPYYFNFPSKTGKDIRVSFESSSDYYYDETQFWDLQATKSGDGYDLTGQWIGTRPSDNNYYHPTTACWNGGDFWPNNGEKSSGETWHWDLTGHISPDSASVTIDMTWITQPDGIEWHTIIHYNGTAWTKGARLVTSGDAPTSDAVVKSEDSGSGSSSGSGTSGAASTGSTSAPTATGSGTATSTGSASGGSSTNSASRDSVVYSQFAMFGSLVGYLAFLF
ncbi:hypothetical protein LTR84_004364 [Exophiala bonariae]|uniref:GH16 domain-containing protein n=1 Tax=Exophiala bonariae TaxID=1690606 RepID=A0AAV9N4F6_9EURO|nr:hypothetical protein LTR84_004364 [Exophiala bonariae]